MGNKNGWLNVMQGKSLATGLVSIPHINIPASLFSPKLVFQLGASLRGLQLWHPWLAVGLESGWSSQSDWVLCCVLGRMLLNDSKKGPAHLHYRRPYGCAVLSILDVLQSLTELKEEKDFVLKVYT